MYGASIKIIFSSGVTTMVDFFFDSKIFFMSFSSEHVIKYLRGILETYLLLVTPANFGILSSILLLVMLAGILLLFSLLSMLHVQLTRFLLLSK